MKTAAGHRDLVEGAPRQRVDPPGRHHDRRLLLVEPRGVAVQRARLPGRQPLVGELRNGRAIAGRPVRLASDHGGGLVLAVSVAGRAREDGDDDLRPKPPQHAHGVFEQDLTRPLLQRLFQGAREPEVVGAGEELSRAVQPPRRGELLRAHEAQAHAEVRSDEVLPALAAGERKIRRLAAHAPGHRREQLGVLVVRMRGDDEEAAMRREAAQRPVDGLQSAGRGGRQRIGRGRRFFRPGRRRRQDEEEREGRGGRSPSPPGGEAKPGPRSRHATS